MIDTTLLGEYAPFVPNPTDSPEQKEKLKRWAQDIKDKRNEILEGKHPKRCTLEGK